MGWSIRKDEQRVKPDCLADDLRPSPASECGHCIRYGDKTCPDHKTSEIPLVSGKVSEAIGQAVKKWIGDDNGVFGHKTIIGCNFDLLKSDIMSAISHYLRSTEPDAADGCIGWPDCEIKGCSHRRPIMPVSVSLEKCGDAVYANSSYLSGNTCRNIAKAVLDAAGVKYHEG